MMFVRDFKFRVVSEELFKKQGVFPQFRIERQKIFDEAHGTCNRFGVFRNLRVELKSETSVLFGDIPSVEMVLPRKVISLRPNSHLEDVKFRAVFSGCSFSTMCSNVAAALPGTSPYWRGWSSTWQGQNTFA